MRRTWLGIGILFSVSCGDDSNPPAYEARLEAAQARVTDATCECAPKILREQCAHYAEAGHEPACSSERAALFASEHAGYAECIAHGMEVFARCLEEASCSERTRHCGHDAYADCGPVPDDLDPVLMACLPRFQCRTGQAVSLDRRCNRTRDCYDNSDEEGCPAR